MSRNYKDKFVGIKLYGFCNGYFGRDSYSDKTIVASGDRWIVAIDDYEGKAEFCAFDDSEDAEALIESWAKEETE